jgi:hypothetical protein
MWPTYSGLKGMPSMKLARSMRQSELVENYAWYRPVRVCTELWGTVLCFKAPTRNTKISAIRRYRLV